jgi:hypothetical protein
MLSKNRVVVEQTAERSTQEFQAECAPISNEASSWIVVYMKEAGTLFLPEEAPLQTFRTTFKNHSTS